ncbi:MAG TPA: 50S ribosomal protein L30 [Polyangiaceae bacterium]|nr:50S ribosomal protein L30 [Polyangiaceae bacterium]
MATKTQLRVTQTRSYIGHPRKTIRATLKGLGLGRIGKQVTVENTPSFRGQIKKVIHLVSVEEIEGDKATTVVEG